MRPMMNIAGFWAEVVIMEAIMQKNAETMIVAFRPYLSGTYWMNGVARM